MMLLLYTAAVYIIGYFSHALYLGKTVYGDGIYYYSWMSLHPSKFAIGPALFWAPVYVLTHNEILVGVTSVLATLFALVLLWDLLLKEFNKTVSLMTILAIAGASNLLFYGSLDVVNSHALTFFAATVFLTLVLRRRAPFVIGIAYGVMGLMRPQDLLYGILLIPLFTKKNTLQTIFGLLVGFLPQLVTWQLTSGKFWLSPYFAHEGFNFYQPHILGVLFNLHNGLFLWTPITIIGVVGLILKKRYWFLLVFLAELYVVASWSTWWQGASYSGRMFVSSLPILAFGVADIFSWIAKRRVPLFLTIVAPLSAINALSIIYFLLTLGR